MSIINNIPKLVELMNKKECYSNFDIKIDSGCISIVLMNKFTTQKDIEEISKVLGVDNVSIGYSVDMNSLVLDYYHTMEDD